MSSRITRLSYSFLTASLLHLAACGDDPEPASFSSATELQKQRAVTAATATDAAIAMFFGSALVGLPDDSTCPPVERSGDTTTITGNCTTDSGDKFLGSITTKNVPGLFGGPEHDPSRPSLLTFDGFGIDDTSDEDEDIAMDGTLTVNTDGSATADLSLTIADLTAHSHATWRQAGELVTADAGGTIDLAGLGSAEIKGSWSTDSDSPAGAVELHGSDVLKADFGATTAEGCVPLTVDGRAAGQLCDSDE
jgi:hypothetical protein